METTKYSPWKQQNTAHGNNKIQPMETTEYSPWKQLNAAHGNNYASSFMQKGYKEVSTIALALVKPFTTSKSS